MPPFSPRRSVDSGIPYLLLNSRIELFLQYSAIALETSDSQYAGIL